MRILFVSSQYPPYELGGYEQVCQEVTLELLSRGHDVRVLTSSAGVKSKQEIHSENVDRSLNLTADIHYYRPLDFFFRLPAQEKENLAELKRIIGKFHPEVIMFWGMYALSHNLPFWAEKWMPGHVAYYLASYWPTDEDIHAAYWKTTANRQATEWVKRPLRAAALIRLRNAGYPPELQFRHVLCCSEYVRDTLVAAGKISLKAGVVYLGTDPGPFLDRRVEERQVLRLLYFGRLVPDKGVHTAIEALGLLKKEGKAEQVHLTILGDGHPDYRKYLEQKVSELDIQDCVRFIRKVDREQIPAQLSCFDVFLFTSIWPEPFGRTIVEAMLAGLVVIGSDVGGSQEIFRDYDRNLLFQPEDARGLADRITLVLGDSGLRHRLTDIGRRLALERFTTSTMTDRIEKFLGEVSRQPSQVGKSL